MGADEADDEEGDHGVQARLEGAVVPKQQDEEEQQRKEKLKSFPQRFLQVGNFFGPESFDAFPPGDDVDEEKHPDEVHRSEEHTSELQSRENLVCRLLLEKKKKRKAATDN